MIPSEQQKTREEVEQEVRALGWWYQHFELPSGVWTGTGEEPSYRPETRWKLIEPYVPEDLSGQTVLDVGGNAGYFSMQMKRRGAGRCVLVESYVEFARQAEFVAKQFGFELEVVNEDIHTFCLTTEDRFDYVLFLGLFYHLKYPVLALDRLAEMTKTRMFCQSHQVGSENDAYAKKADYARGADDAILNEPGFPRLLFIESLY
ncbi:MAG: class I SAM-dependent methyltransferase, partial [Terriglobia bacterium]